MRRRPKGKPNAEVYRLKVDSLGELERLSREGVIDLLYGDESRVSLQPCVPYGWQFRDEEVSQPSQQGAGLNCFALLSRDNRCLWATTRQSIDSQFVIEQLERLALDLKRLTVVVLDNARAHTAEAVTERLAGWQQRGLFVFYLPSYSPHLNIAERLWRKLK